MLYDSWLIIAALAAVIDAVAIIRFLSDWKRSDLIDVVMCFFGGLVSILAALNAGSLDFVCTGGATCINGLQTYTGEYYFLYLFDPFWLIMWFLGIMAAIITLSHAFKRQSYGYSPE